MIAIQTFKLGLVFSLSSSLITTLPTIAATFQYGTGEAEIIYTEFDNSTGWTLNGTTISGGTITGTRSFGTASYSLPTAVDPSRGEVFLYWSGIYPNGAHRERDKYYVGLQYADNAPVCYNGSTIVGNPPCSGVGVSEVDENAELRVEMRPEDRTNTTNTYNRLYIDPDFDPVNNFSPTSTRVNVVSPYQAGTATNYRLNVKKKNNGDYEASLAFWNGSWQILGAKTNFTSPLLITPGNWIDATRQISDPVTFEAINLQFRQDTVSTNANRYSALTALALTQIIPPASSNPTPIPEPSSPLSPIVFLGVGFLWTLKKGTKR